MNEAIEVRKKWLAMMGMSEEEIAESCDLDPPTDLAAETAEYEAMLRIQEGQR